MKKRKINAAFTGGGLASVEGLGGYAVISTDVEFVAFSGASIGALNAVCLSAGKQPMEIRDFLAENVESFGKFIIGRKRIQKAVDAFLGNMLYRDLPKECIISITPLRCNFPSIITRDNAGNLTAGEAIALSAALPGLFLPGFVKLEGKSALVLDGGILQNPPLHPDYKNFLFSYQNSGSMVDNFWNRRRWDIEESADYLFAPYTEYGVLGKHEDVLAVFEEGKLAMEASKSKYSV